MLKRDEMDAAHTLHAHLYTAMRVGSLDGRGIDGALRVFNSGSLGNSSDFGNFTNLGVQTVIDFSAQGI